MINERVRELVAEYSDDTLLFTDPAFDNSIVGISTDGKHVIYALDEMVRELMKDEDMLEDDAEDFIEYNTLRALPYADIDKRPIIIDSNMLYYRDMFEQEEE